MSLKTGLFLLILSFQTAGAAAPLCATLYSSPRNRLVSEAKYHGLTAKMHEELYRFDSRSPLVLKQANGFIPHPEKKVGSLHDHVKPSSQGTTNYVSFTKHANNELILKDSFLPFAEIGDKFPTKKSEEHYLRLISNENIEALGKKNESLYQEIQKLIPDYNKDSRFEDTIKKSDLSAEQKAEATRMEDEISENRVKQVLFKRGYASPIVFVFYQYQVKNVFGVETAKIGIPHEAEVVSSHADSHQIRAYRRVYVVMAGNFKMNERDEGSTITDAEFNNMNFRKGLRSGENQTIFGAWEKF